MRSELPCAPARDRSLILAITDRLHRLEQVIREAVSLRPKYDVLQEFLQRTVLIDHRQTVSLPLCHGFQRIADIVARRAKREILVHDLAHPQIGSIPTTPRPSSTIGRELVARYVTEKMTTAN